MRNKHIEKATCPPSNDTGCPQNPDAEASFLHSSKDPGKKQAKKFELGHICVTIGAALSLELRDITASLSRHMCGDWGDMCEADKQLNDGALQLGFRLFSMYFSKSGTKFYIITEWDRSLTTVLLPEEY